MILAALVAAASPLAAARHVARAVMVAAGLLAWQSMSSKTTPGANDNATGVAAVLELARLRQLDPLSDTRVILVFPGGEEVGSAGMRAWLRSAGRNLDPRTTLVVNLDAVGSAGHLVVANREGLTGRLDLLDLDLAMIAAERAGLELQSTALPNPTDGAAARAAGLPVVSLASLDDGWIGHLHRETDTAENVEWSTVEDAVRLTEEITRLWQHRSVR
ncbi:M28 family metallopeptidase [Kribbella kalugense]|uniref:M28 family metallopeptidase n=1 Tax=Kribbella kalugense TaxID=2512221 RepID=UPI001417062F|nr:M28 family peptidase [Kribbella kalugense]